ncbi:hypothetical protein JGU66_36265, partial [Myxococcaceae bacterium JPH2]|nr:hypothetical protein [Myxococcaceae bacterium JPH2]
ALQPARSLSHAPLFQSLLALQNVPSRALQLPGLSLKPVEFETRSSKFDLSVAFVETDHGLQGSLEYSTDLFEQRTIVRMAEHLRILLDGIVAQPDAQLAHLPLLPQHERQQLL